MKSHPECFGDEIALNAARGLEMGGEAASMGARFEACPACFTSAASMDVSLEASPACVGPRCLAAGRSSQKSAPTGTYVGKIGTDLSKFLPAMSARHASVSAASGTGRPDACACGGDGCEAERRDGAN